MQSDKEQEPDRKINLEDQGKVTPIHSSRKGDESIPQLLGDLSRDTSELIKREMDLARVEINEKFDQAKTGIVSLGSAGVLILFGGLSIVAGLVFLIAFAIPLWISAILVGVILSAMGGALLSKAKKDLEPRKLRPSQTLDSLDENKEILKEQRHDRKKAG
jgi:uncharacterized membrane protein YqjE